MKKHTAPKRDRRSARDQARTASSKTHQPSTGERRGISATQLISWEELLGQR